MKPFPVQTSFFQSCSGRLSQIGKISSNIPSNLTVHCGTRTTYFDVLQFLYVHVFFFAWWFSIPAILNDQSVMTFMMFNRTCHRTLLHRYVKRVIWNIQDLHPQLVGFWHWVDMDSTPGLATCLRSPWSPFAASVTRFPAWNGLKMIESHTFTGKSLVSGRCSLHLPGAFHAGNGWVAGGCWHHHEWLWIIPSFPIWSTGKFLESQWGWWTILGF